MTVKELIIKLQKCNQNAEIIGESPYQDEFVINNVTQNDYGDIVWLESQ